MSAQAFSTLQIINELTIHSDIEADLTIALVNMPFYSTRWASIQLGILKSTLSNQKIMADDLYLNMAFAKEIGWKKYENISQLSNALVGEWLFSYAAYGIKDAVADEKYFAIYDQELSTLFPEENYKKTLTQLKYEIVPQFINQCVDTIKWDKYFSVGFSCTFQQIVPSLALAKKIKFQYPHIKIIFGGTGVESPMGDAIKTSHEYVDEIFSGEGEIAIIEYFRSNENNNKSNQAYTSKKEVQLNDIPTPDYSIFYNLADRINYSAHEIGGELVIPIEFSRGCWWGAKKHCTFCGLNGATMAFRSKSSPKALNEIVELSKKHDRYIFQVVDNIMDFRYFKDLLPILRDKNCDYEFFFEVKSNLKPEEIKLLKQSGCHNIQPGIESLNSHVLELMQKGTTAIQNLTLLKWGRYYGIGISWNILYGFPGETENDYKLISELLPKIVHFEPPVGELHKIRMDRFSPNFVKKDEFGFNNVKYARCYDYIFPSGVNKWDLAYYYEGEVKTEVSETTYQAVRSTINNWLKLWEEKNQRPFLYFRNGLDSLHVIDQRMPNHSENHFLDKLHRLIFLLTMDLPINPESLLQHALKAGYSEHEFSQALNDLLTENILIYLDEKYFNLALPWGKHWTHRKPEEYYSHES